MDKRKDFHFESARALLSSSPYKPNHPLTDAPLLPSI